MGVHKIYKLTDAEGSIFYVGYTSLDLKERLRNHLYMAKVDKSPIHKYLLSMKSIPSIAELDSSEDRFEALGLEKKWINRLSREGHNLVNVKDAFKPEKENKPLITVPEIEEENINKLTVTEIGIIQEAANGLISKEISTKLGMSHKTVEVHRHNIMKKLGARNFIQIVLGLYKKGIIY